MSTLLYRIGKTAYAKPWFFIIGWIALLGAIVAGVGINGIKMTSEFSLPGTPSQEVMDTLAEQFPAAAGGNASIVFTVPEGESISTPENAQAIAAAAGQIYTIEDVVAPSAESQAAAAQMMTPELMAQLPYGPLMLDETTPVPGVYVSKDGSVAMLQLQFTEQVQELPAHVPEDIISAADNAADGTDIRVIPSDSLKAFEMPFGPNEVIGLIFAGLVLVLTLGSLVAAGLPLLTALIGVGIGVGATYAMSSFIDLNSMTPTLALMIGLAVGIDYALFIVNRQRQLVVREGLTAGEAAGRAVGTAGTAVFFAGMTVIIALCGLSVIGIGFLTVMALSAALTVLCAVAIAISLLPALLGLVGERICSKKYRAKHASRVEQNKNSFADKYVSGLVKRRWWVIAGSVLVLGVMAIPMASMRLDFPSGASSNVGTDSRDSYDALAEGFGPGFNGMLVVVAHNSDGSPLGQEQLGMVTQAVAQTPGVALAMPTGVSEDGEYATLQVIPTTGPADEETKDLISELRDPALTEATGVEIGVTGFTAMSIDIADKLADVFPIYVAIILVLSLIILLMVFRSIWVPVKATLGFLLSVLATLGVTTAVFQWGWLKELFGFDNGGPLVSFMPIIVTGILFGLAMDYEMFLVSSMREAHVHGSKGRAAVKVGFDIASRVVVAAAIIMISVFASFIFGGEIMIRQMGFALAFGILVDAFVVRLTLVPAVMAVLGEKAWWLPKWLDKILPNLDVEGERLLAKLSAEKAAEPEKESVTS